MAAKLTSAALYDSTCSEELLMMGVRARMASGGIGVGGNRYRIGRVAALRFGPLEENVPAVPWVSEASVGRGRVGCEVGGARSTISDAYVDKSRHLQISTLSV